jgi:hypothetical protein
MLGAPQKQAWEADGELLAKRAKFPLIAAHTARQA